ncbi:MAG: hypothetical protein Q9220_003590 [cf. Caloplaca sp. 1 TL-2023]
MDVEQSLKEALLCFHQIQPSPAHLTKDYEILYTKLSVQRIHLVLWGKYLAIGQVKDVKVPPDAINCLNEICSLFSSAWASPDVYGLRRKYPPPQGGFDNMSQHDVSSRGPKLFEKIYVQYLRQLGAQPDLALHGGNNAQYVFDTSGFAAFCVSLDHLTDALYASAGLKTPMEHISWSTVFYQEVATVSEDCTGLMLLTYARSGMNDIFADYAEQRLIERDGRPRVFRFKSFGRVPGSPDHSIFQLWHSALHKMLPKRLMYGDNRAIHSLSDPDPSQLQPPKSTAKQPHRIVHDPDLDGTPS